MSKTLTREERAAHEQKITALNEEARLNWRNTSWREEMAEVLSEQITQGFEQENLIDLLANVEYLSPTGRAYVAEAKGMRAHWISPGGYIEESTIREDRFEIQRDTVAFHVSEMEDKMEADFGPTAQRVIDLGIQRLAGEINLRVLRTFQDAVPSSSPYYTSAAGLSLTTLNAAIREVKDETNDDVVIIGRRTITDKIIDGVVALNGGAYGAYIPETNEQLLRRGVMGEYRGANIVNLKNYKDDNDNPFFPANELWVVGKDASKFAFWGGAKTKQFTEQDNWFWHYMQRRDFGGIVWRPERLRRIVDTSIVA